MSRCTKAFINELNNEIVKCLRKKKNEHLTTSSKFKISAKMNEYLREVKNFNGKFKIGYELQKDTLKIRVTQ